MEAELAEDLEQLPALESSLAAARHEASALQASLDRSIRTARDAERGLLVALEQNEAALASHRARPVYSPPPAPAAPAAQPSAGGSLTARAQASASAIPRPKTPSSAGARGRSPGARRAGSNGSAAAAGDESDIPAYMRGARCTCGNQPARSSSAVQ